MSYGVAVTRCVCVPTAVTCTVLTAAQIFSQIRSCCFGLDQQMCLHTVQDLGSVLKLSTCINSALCACCSFECSSHHTVCMETQDSHPIGPHWVMPKCQHMHLQLSSRICGAHQRRAHQHGQLATGWMPHPECTLSCPHKGRSLTLKGQ
jgi:hypothetical protein